MTGTEADCTRTTDLHQLDPVLSAMQQAMLNIFIFLVVNTTCLVLEGKLTPVTCCTQPSSAVYC